MNSVNLILILNATILVAGCMSSTISEKNETASNNIIKKQKPSLTFEIELIKKGEELDARFGDNSETKVLFKIDGKEIDSDFEIGIGEALNNADSTNNSEATAFVTGEFSEKSYYAKYVNDSTFSVLKIRLEENNNPDAPTRFAEPIEVWTRFYEYNPASGWRLKDCIGDCTGLTIYETKSGLPLVYASGGEGLNVEWKKREEDYYKNEGYNGAGFDYNDCSQGIEPIKASSTLSSQGKFNYKVDNLAGDPTTAWVEGKKGYGIGEWFEVKAISVNNIYNGYQASPKSFIDNSRVKKMKIYKDDKPICILILKDEMGRQGFMLPDDPDHSEQHRYRFEILEVYPGKKFEDVAISEIDYVLCCMAAQTTINYPGGQEQINKIKTDQSISIYDEKKDQLISGFVTKVISIKHQILYKVKTISHEIIITDDHPLFEKTFGFTSLNRLIKAKNVSSIFELIDQVEFKVWDEKQNKSIFESLISVSKIDSYQDTYSIKGIKNGEYYLANGFITKTY